MTDKPIIFSAPMARALLDGSKTQTRRILKPQPPEGSTFFAYDIGDQGFFARFLDEDENGNADLPFAKISAMKGDRLWVRENWTTGQHLDKTPPRDIPQEQSIGYPADPDGGPWLGRIRPSIHMPRWASRLTLTVTDVRVERLQGISRGDAMQEGCPHPNMQDGPNPVDWFRGVWSDINGPDAWDQNPWVVAYTFTVKKRNIDQCA